jgi:head-tail adaptor
MMRYQANIKPYYRIKWGEKIFDINAILNEGERNVSLTLFCTEAV